MNKKVTIITFLIPSLHQSIYFSIYLFPPNLRNSATEIPPLPQGVACFYYVVPSLHVSNHHHRQDILLYFTSYASTSTEIAPLFLFFFFLYPPYVPLTSRCAREREREREKCLENTAPLRAYHHSPSAPEYSSHTHVHVQAHC